MQRSLIIALAVLLVLVLVSVGGVYWAYNSSSASFEVRQEWREYADGWEVTLIASVWAPDTATVSPEAEIDFPSYSLRSVKVTFPEQPTVQQPGASYTVPLSFEQAEAGPTVIVSANATEHQAGFMRNRELVLGPQKVKLTPPTRQLTARLAELDGAWMEAKPHLSVRQALDCWKVRGSVGYEEREKVRLLVNKFLIASERFYLDGKLIEERAYTPDENLHAGFECDIPRAAGPKNHMVRVEGSLWHRKVGSTDEAPQWEEWPLKPAEEPLVIEQWKPSLSPTAVPDLIKGTGKYCLHLWSDTPGLIVKAAGKVLKLDAEGKGELYFTAKPGSSTLRVTGTDPSTGVVVERIVPVTEGQLKLTLSKTSLDLTRGEKLTLRATCDRQGYAGLQLALEDDMTTAITLAEGPIGPDQPLEATWDGRASWSFLLGEPGQPVPPGRYIAGVTFRDGEATDARVSPPFMVISNGQKTHSTLISSGSQAEGLTQTTSPYYPEKSSPSHYDASFKLAFTGKRVGFQYYKLPHGGRVEIFLEGKQLERLDLASPNADYHEGYWLSQPLSPGAHVLEVRRVENPKDYRPVDIRSFRLWP